MLLDVNAVYDFVQGILLRTLLNFFVYAHDCAPKESWLFTEVYKYTNRERK